MSRLGCLIAAAAVIGLGVAGSAGAAARVAGATARRAGPTAAAGGEAVAQAMRPLARPITVLGSGAEEVWVLRPVGQARSIVVFGHGWSTPTPDGFGAWVAHLRARGNIVVYPRYRLSAAESTTSALSAFRTGLTTAFRSLGATALPVVAVGKSFGGSAVFYYAAQAHAWGIPAPRALLSIFPALPIGSLPQRRPPQSTAIELFVGDADTTAGRGGADAFWRWLSGHPTALKRYSVIRSRPGFVANHDSAQRTDAIAQAVFWKPLDALVARARLSGAASVRGG